MKGIIDQELKIIIKNQIANYNRNTDRLLYEKSSVTRYRKNGFLAYDENGKNIGIVFMSDDKRKCYFGNAEILFFNKLENEFGIWRIIKIKGNYLPFEKLEKFLQTNNEYICITDTRVR